MKDDLRKMAARLESLGVGMEIGQIVKNFPQVFDTVRGHLNDQVLLQRLYLESDSAVVLPDKVWDIVRRFCDGKIDRQRADRELTGLERQYGALLSEISLEHESLVGNQ